jgi:glycerophosphoryl diester phosphodiesterase
VINLSPGIAARHKAIVVHGGSAPRGYRDVLEALDRAIRLGAQGLELDVRRTRDGTLVVHHDADIDGEPLASMSFYTAVERARRLGYRPPAFADLLDRLREALWLDIELKEAGYEGQVLDAAAEAGFTSDTCVVTSFEQAALDGVHAANRGIQTGLLVWDCTWSEALTQFRRSGARFLGPDYQILDRSALLDAEREGVMLLPWTVNVEVEVSRLLEASTVAGVITDDPVMAMRTVRQ